MGTENANLLPATTGLDLGSPNQKWDLYGQNLTVDEIASSSPNPAQSGTIRLASGDSIGVRKADNTSDLTLNFSGDALNWNGSGGVVSDFTSNSANPASTGAIRLASGDQIVFRSNDNTADLNGLSKGVDDVFTVGDNAGIKAAAFISETANPALAGQVRLANADVIYWRSQQNLVNYGITLDANDRLVDTAYNGLVLTGANPNILLGGTTNAFPMIQRSATTIVARLADNSGNANFAANNVAMNLLTSAGGFTTTGIGFPVLIASVASTNLNAASSGNIIASAPATGMYRILYYLYITTAGNVVNLTGTFGWTDDNSIASTITTGNIACNTAGANSGTVTGQGEITIYAKLNTAITWATGLSGAIGASGKYAIQMRVLYLG